jgi:uncharacterized protein with PQ loop repeat
MLPDFVVTAANICQTAVPFIALSAYLPQWVKLARTRSSRDISLRSWCIWTLSALCALFYAIVQLILNRRGWPLVFSAGIGLFSVLLTVFLIFRYRPGRPAGAETGEGNNMAETDPKTQRLVERFLRYVKVHSSSRNNVEERFPSTEEQVE